MNKKWEQLKKDAERYRTDKKRELLLTWSGGESHTIEVWNEQGTCIAISTINWDSQKVSSERVVKHMKSKIQTGKYNWVYDGLEESYNKK